MQRGVQRKPEEITDRESMSESDMADVEKVERGRLAGVGNRSDAPDGNVKSATALLPLSRRLSW